MGIKDSIIKNMGASVEEITIMNALKKCFYAEHKPDEEARMVEMIQYKNGESRERYGLHASAIIGDNLCIRCQVLSLLFRQSQGEDLPLKTLAIFEEGNAIHEKWQRLFIRGGLGTAIDMDCTRFVQAVELSYTPDAIIQIDDKRYVVEIKSMNTFNYQKSNEHTTGALQCLLYMYYSNIHNGFVLMEDKNTQDFKIQIVEYDENKIMPYVDKLKEIQKLKADFIKTKKPPKRICENADCEKAENCIMRDCCFNINRKSLFDRDDLIYKVMKSHIGKKGSIRQFYSGHKDRKELAEFIKKQYGTGGCSGTQLIDLVNYNSSGFDIICKRMNGEECETVCNHYTWNEVAKVTINIIEGENDG